MGDKTHTEAGHYKTFVTLWREWHRQGISLDSLSVISISC